MNKSKSQEAGNLNNNGGSFARRWLSFRPELKVMDCTIRDGGLMNNHKFEDTVVKAVYQACVDAGIDYMELGYKGSGKVFSPRNTVPGSTRPKKTCGVLSETMRQI